MKPLLLNTYDWGGAGIATRRILQALRDLGVEAEMLVNHSRSDDPHVISPKGYLWRAIAAGRIVTDPLPTKVYREREGNFSINWLPDRINHRLRRLDPDLIHLNWVGEGFFDIKSIADMPAPVVWRLPDMWAFTGGCHYSGDCRRYEDRCGTCPRLGSTRERDLTRWTWNRKAAAFGEAHITVVATSTWLADAARESSLFADNRIEVIPNPLDTTVFQPRDSADCRNRLDLPADKHLVLFGAQYATSDPRKGFDLLQEALLSLHGRDSIDDVELVVFGGTEPEESPDFGYPVSYVGYVDDTRSLADLYSAADVMVVPSRYEGFGQTASESLACGTPVVAFDATGPSDIIDHRKTGYLADPYDSDDLAAGIKWILADEDRRSKLGEEGRSRAVSHYEMETVGTQYRDLYEDVLGRHK